MITSFLNFSLFKILQEFEICYTQNINYLKHFKRLYYVKIHRKFIIYQFKYLMGSKMKDNHRFVLNKEV
jgi:hypothetical protein